MKPDCLPLFYQTKVSAIPLDDSAPKIGNALHFAIGYRIP